MVPAITNTSHAAAAAGSETQTQPVAKSATSSTQSHPQPAARIITDTVQISSAAQALQEAIESPAQTAKEASAGDHQAQRLLAREAAARAER